MSSPCRNVELNPLLMEAALGHAGAHAHDQAEEEADAPIAQASWKLKWPVVVVMFVPALAGALCISTWTTQKPTSSSSMRALPDVVGLSEVEEHGQTTMGSISHTLLATTFSGAKALVRDHVGGRRSWAETMPGVKDFTGTVFYPFSGVDALTAIPLFPHARSVVLAALHSVGDCDVDSWKGDRLSGRQDLVNSLLAGNFGGYGYFSTEEMYERLDDTGYGGVAFLLAVLDLLDREPISVECGQGVGPSGSSLGLPAGKAVRILHRPKSAAARETSELIYAQMDLLTPTPALDGFLKTLQSQKPLFTMMKATGYIIRRHEDNPVNRRVGYQLDARPLLKLIVDHSVGVLQDDTGVRVSCLHGWTKSWYGEYVGPAWLANMTLDYGADYDDSLHALTCHTNGAKLPCYASSYNTGVNTCVTYGYPLFYTMPTCPGRHEYDQTCYGSSLRKRDAGLVQPTVGFALLALKSDS